MNDTLWKKAGSSGPSKEVMAFLAGTDVLLDRSLLLFDIQASAAHANGLQQIKILSEEENRRLQETLARFAREVVAGERTLDDRYEDGHSAIESWLTELLGPLGQKIHTGRSRNDQIAVALRLYLRHQLQQLHGVCLQVATVLLKRAEAEGHLPMPGHTHLQKAMPSSVGMWLAGHAEAFLDNAEAAAAISHCINASPLGTASGFGVNLPLARDLVARELAFPRLVVNPQNAQNSRGKVELLALSALAGATLDLRRVAWDLSLFASEEFNYVKIPSAWCTGSSIMPNKNNPDVVELMRATHAVVVGAQAELNTLLSLPSGYQRDLQATKPPVMRAFEQSLQALVLLPGLIDGLQWQAQTMQAAITPAMFATDRATELAAKGMPFREAYRQVAAELDELSDQALEKSLNERVSPGAAGQLMLPELCQRLEQLSKAKGQ